VKKLWERALDYRKHVVCELFCVSDLSVGEEFAQARARKRQADYDDNSALTYMLRRRYDKQRRAWAATLVPRDRNMSARSFAAIALTYPSSQGK
jgi:hypothetical protein